MRALSWALFAALLPGLAEAGGGAVLRLETAGGKLVKAVPSVAAEWTEMTEEHLKASPIFHDHANEFGCSKHKSCNGCALMVTQGNCSFAQKAKMAQDAGAALLIVQSAKDGAPMGMATVMQRGSSMPTIPAVMVSKAAGRIIMLRNKEEGPLVAITYKSAGHYYDLLSEVFVGVLATSLVMLGAWHSVEDLRRPETKDKFNEEVFAVEEHSGPHFVLFGSLMLTVLFFFMKYLIYVLLFLFATGAVSTTTMLVEPAIGAWLPHLRNKKACTLNKRVAYMLGLAEDHTWTEAIAEIVGGILATAFLIWRNNDAYGWALQNTIAIMLLLTIQRTLRLPNLRIGTIMLICTFFFDIFWVFISPKIFQKSVMIEVATGGGTGQSVPMVLKIPAMSPDIPGQFKILGLGDIAIPGLLISFLLRHDLLSKNRRCDGYFTWGVIGYSIGLVATFVSLYLMKHGQPALLFLVPGTLIPTCCIALRKGELKALWTANYGPPETPEGYESLAGDKQA